ncbi:MAG: hypothetical protein V4560_14290 [Bacteroidota bacterium]
MKNLTHLAFVAVLIFSCKGKPSESNNIRPADSTSKKTVSKIQIDDESLYSKSFLNNLRSLNYSEPIRLVKDQIIVGGDTATFPNDLVINKEYYFKANNDTIIYQLNLTRINLTDVKFQYLSKLKDSLLFTETGMATLNSGFFLASEAPDDEKTGEGYGANDYTNVKKSDLSLIKIGLGRDDAGLLRALIVPNGNNQSIAFPSITLRAR